MRHPGWTWHWAWKAFLRWSLHPVLPGNLTAGERWQVVLWSLLPGIKHHHMAPTAEWLHRHLPTAILLFRLERHGAGWYRVPSMPAAIHLWRRVSVQVLEGDFVKIVGGVVTMRGYVDEEEQVCEFFPIEEQ